MNVPKEENENSKKEDSDIDEEIDEKNSDTGN